MSFTEVLQLCWGGAARRRGVLALAVLLAASGCQRGGYRAASLPPEFAARPAAAAPQLDLSRLARSQGQNQTIQAGDMLEVSVLTGLKEADPEEGWKLRVLDDGMVDVPLIGPVYVVGMEPTGASRAIRETGVGRGIYRNPQVTVRLDEHRTNKVTVTGEVEEPGVHELPVANSDLLAALVAAGGLKETANTQVEIRHPPRFNQPPPAGAAGPDSLAMAAYHSGRSQVVPPRIIQVNLTKAVERGNDDLRMYDGSVVVVGKQPPRIIHVMGLVNHPGQFEMPVGTELRLLDAIALGGGRTQELADKVTVIRQNPRGGDPIVVDCSVREAQQDGAANIRLAAGDLVKVDETPATFVVDTLGKFIRFGLTGSIPLF